MRKTLLLILLLFNLESFSSYILIPMDDSQTNHLKSYGIAFLAIENEIKVDCYWYEKFRKWVPFEII